MTMKRIKIVRIQSRICIGGPALHSELLSKYLPERGYQNILVSGRVEPGEFCKVEELAKAGYDVRIIDDMRRSTVLWSDLEALFRLYRLIKRERPQIVCTHTAKAGAIGRLAAILAGVPVIFHTFHGHVFEHYFSRAVTAFFLLIERILARFTDCIIAISPSQYRDLTEKYHIAPASRFAIVRLGLELDPLLYLRPTDELKKSLGLPADSILIGVIGRLVPIKNHLSTLRIMKTLRQLDDRCRLLIVGDGPERPNIEAFVEAEGLKDRVLFTGWVMDMASIYAGIDVLLLTSLNEGTPLTIIEAMAAGVPVVSSSVGGVPDLIVEGKTGMLFKPNDDRDAAVKIAALLSDDRLRRDMICEARRFVGQVYNYRRMIAEIDALYRLHLQKSQ